MTYRYVSRTIEPVLQQAAEEFPAVVLTGPRQSGKTTVLKMLFRNTHRYVSMEAPDVREAAIMDPRGFLSHFEPPVILDEIQYTPELLPYIKERIDAERHKTGQYILTGSQNLMLMENVTESLAGRTAILHLMPFTNREREGEPKRPFPWEKAPIDEPHLRDKKVFSWEQVLRGSYPEIATQTLRDFRLWQAAYVQTYLERDVRSLRAVGNITLFQSFLRVLAIRSGQLLNMADISRDLGVVQNTVRAWLSVLEATHQIIVLRPYHANVGKRLVKTPKIYFTDTGLLCYLTGISDPVQAEKGPMGGALFETSVFLEIVKGFLHRGIQPQVYFWRTSAGSEVDFIIGSDTRLVAVEAKQTATPRPAIAKGLRAFQRDFPDSVHRAFLVHGGTVQLPLGNNILALPFTQL